MTNILTTLLLTQVCAEWVEISQQHYRKPIRTHNPFVSPDKVIHVEETTKSWAYNNRSVAEYNWNKSPTRTPNIVDGKRIQHFGTTVRTTERIDFEDNDPDEDEETMDEFRQNYGKTQRITELKKYGKPKDMIKRVPNINNDKRVYVGNTVKTTTSKFEDEELNFEADIVDYELRPYSSTKISTEVNKYNKQKGTSTRVPNINKANRIYVGSTIKNSDRIISETHKPNLDVDFLDDDLRAHTTKTSSELNDYEQQKGTIERVPNIGNVKRVQLNNSPVKSPAVQKVVRGKGSTELHENDYHTGDLQTEMIELEHKKNLEAFNRKMYIDNVKKQHNDEMIATFPPDNKQTSFTEVMTKVNTKSSKEDFNNYTTKNLFSNKSTFTTDSEDFNNYETQGNTFYKNNNMKIIETTEKNSAISTEVTDSGENILTKTKIKPKSNVLNDNINKNEASIDFNTEPHESHHLENDKKQESHFSTERPTTKGSHIVPQPDADAGTRNQNENKKNDAPSKTKTNIKKENSMENVIKFMKVVADTISKNSRRSFSGKMQYLHELKDTILANIEERIDSTWPDDDGSSARRRSRSAHASGRGHVQLPSSESALMTISFLTFAVFLIKLVLQVIQTYKNKTMMVAPLVVAAAGRNVMFSHHGHH